MKTRCKIGQILHYKWHQNDTSEKINETWQINMYGMTCMIYLYLTSNSDLFWTSNI